jgi:hypothetical protein
MDNNNKITITFEKDDFENLKRLLLTALSYDTEHECLDENEKLLANQILSIPESAEASVFSSFYDLKETKLHKYFNIIYGARSNGKQHALEEYRTWHFARTEKMNQPAFDKKIEEPDGQTSIYDFDINGEKESNGE